MTSTSDVFLWFSLILALAVILYAFAGPQMIIRAKGLEYHKNFGFLRMVLASIPLILLIGMLFFTKFDPNVSFSFVAVISSGFIVTMMKSLHEIHVTAGKIMIDASSVDIISAQQRQENIDRDIIDDKAVERIEFFGRHSPFWPATLVITEHPHDVYSYRLWGYSQQDIAHLQVALSTLYPKVYVG